MAMHSTVGFSLSALGAWAVGVALDAAGGPQSSAAWMAAFSVLAAGILLGPLALYWSRRETPVNRSQLSIIVALGTTQTLAWASSYYLPAILADPIARDLGVSSNWIFAAFSASLVISAMLGPRVGRQIDLVGGRSVLSLSNLVLAAGLALLGLTYSIPVLLVAWLLLGIGMGAGLYDAAFGALGRIYGDAARRSITGITLIAGFASTVGWPLTAWGLETIGWRNTCFAWAAAHILIGLPINWLMLPPVAGREGGGCRRRQAAHSARPHHDPAGVCLCRGLERHRRDGRASAAHSRSRRRDLAAGGGGRRADRPVAGGGAHLRGELSVAGIIRWCRPGSPA